MPVFGKLDLGPSNPWKMPRSGLHTAVVEIPGGYAVPYGVDSTHPSWRLVFKYQARNTVGQYAALSQNAMEQLGRQLEELSRNPDQQPVYIQLFAGTGLVGGAINQPQDGYYYITSCEVNYTEPFTGVGTVSMDVEYVSPGPPRSVGMSTSGGALSTGFGGSVTNWCAYPLNATIPLVDASRTGAEGAVQINIGPFLNPSPFVPSATISDWWKGGCQVHDVMAAIGSNAVPLAGLFTNVNWIEVFGKDHRFTGDVILTNGLHLWSLALTASPGITGYAWVAGQWQQFGTLTYNDVGTNSGTLRQVTLQRVSLEEVRADLWLSTTAGAWSRLTMRLQRGAWTTRLEFTPMAENNTSSSALKLTLPSNAKIVYNSTNIQDEVLTPTTSLATDGTFGYAAAIIANSSFPFIAGLLYQDTTSNQPFVSGSTILGLGDTGGPAQNATKQYGVFCAPFVTPQNLQAEAESGTLDAGWTSQANASASAGNEAKCASTTVATRADVFGTAWVPPAGAYDVWFSVKVTSAAGAAAEMQLGLWNSTDSVFVGSTTYKANQVTTGYVWYKVAAGVTPTATKNMRFRAVTTATLGTDWFLDQAVLVPTTSTTSRSTPQDHWSQFEYDRTTRIRTQ